MNNEDIIRRFLNLHPDWPIEKHDRYGVSGLTLIRMLEASAAAERKTIEQRVLKSNMTMANRLYVVNDLVRARGQV